MRCHQLQLVIRVFTGKTGKLLWFESVHEISNNMGSATSKGSDQPAHMPSLIRAFACRLNILLLVSYWRTSFGGSKLNRRLHRLICVYTCQNATLFEITCRGSFQIEFEIPSIKKELNIKCFLSAEFQKWNLRNDSSLLLMINLLKKLNK